MARTARPRVLPNTTGLAASPPKPVEAGDPARDLLPVSIPPAPELKTSADPVSGMQVDEEWAAGAGLKLEHKGRIYFFVSRESKAQFEKQPELYGAAETQAAPALAAPSASVKPTSVSTTVKDPVCGMDEDPKDAAAIGLRTDYKGKTHSFCSDECKKKFDKEPEK
jgi:YHS domain-containing protein